MRDILASAHATVVMLAAGLLATALLLEVLTTDADPMIHAHADLRFMVHIFAYLSVLLSAWPLARPKRGLTRRTLAWHLPGIAGVIVLLALGQVMAGAGLALVLGFGSLVADSAFGRRGPDGRSER